MCWKFHGRGLRIQIRVCLHCWRWDRLQAKIVSIFNPAQESLALLSSSSCWFCSSGWSASGPPGWRSQRSTGLVRKGNVNIFGLTHFCSLIVHTCTIFLFCFDGEISIQKSKCEEQGSLTWVTNYFSQDLEQRVPMVETESTSTTERLRPTLRASRQATTAPTPTTTTTKRTDGTCPTSTMRYNH